MAHPDYRPSPLLVSLTNKFSGFCISKTLIIISVIFVDFPKESPVSNVAATKHSEKSPSLFVISDVAAGNDVVAINDFYGNYFNRNQDKFDTLQSTAHDASDNVLSSQSIKNCSRTRNFVRRICGNYPYATKLATKNSSDGDTTNSAKIQQTTEMTSTFFNLNKNLASSLSSPPSSPLLQQQQRSLSRPKRYLSFPEGSSFSVAVCFTVGIIGNPRYNYMSFGLNWGVAYDLPNTTWILNHLHGVAKRPVPVAVWHRRSRRSLYKEIENVVDNMGYNGRECVLRALCESRQYFQKTKMGIIGEMLRTIFSLPKQRIFTRELAENGDIELYDSAYRKARSIVDCAEKYECGFSLLELAFGKYSTPPDGYYSKH